MWILYKNSATFKNGKWLRSQLCAKKVHFQALSPPHTKKWCIISKKIIAFGNHNLHVRTIYLANMNINMSKRLWTETRQVGAKNSTQKLSKTKAKLSQAEPSWAQLKGLEEFWERFYQGIREEKGTSLKIRPRLSRVNKRPKNKWK